MGAGFSEYRLHQSSLAENRVYNQVWMFWGRNLLGVFVPFFLLLFLNGSILWKLRRNISMRSAMLRSPLGHERGRKGGEEGGDCQPGPGQDAGAGGA